MNLFAPSYYNDFKCIAATCQHTCCQGWEIGIDEESITNYFHIDGPLGEKLRSHISFDDTPHFTTEGESDRCPFLQNDGLCEIIKNLGEDNLCQICRDHPRFRNFLPNRTEIGLGLCCEEAGRIILNYTNKTQIIPIQFEDEASTAEEKVFFEVRNVIYEILQDRTKPFGKRIDELMQQFDITYNPLVFKKTVDELKKVEILDPQWLTILQESTTTLSIDNDVPLVYEQLMCYLVYRHLPLCFEGYGILQILKFILTCFYLFINAYSTTHNVIEAARLFSSEIEYSEENINILLDNCIS